MTHVRKTMLGAFAASVLGLFGLVRAEGAAPTQAPSGDASRGQKLLESRGCFDCHRIGDRGSRVGPNLSDIGGRRTPGFGMPGPCQEWMCRMASTSQ